MLGAGLVITAILAALLWRCRVLRTHGWETLLMLVLPFFVGWYWHASIPVREHDWNQLVFLPLATIPAILPMAVAYRWVRRHEYETLRLLWGYLIVVQVVWLAIWMVEAALGSTRPFFRIPIPPSEWGTNDILDISNADVGRMLVLWWFMRRAENTRQAWLLLALTVGHITFNIGYLLSLVSLAFDPGLHHVAQFAGGCMGIVLNVVLLTALIRYRTREPLRRQLAALLAFGVAVAAALNVLWFSLNIWPILYDVQEYLQGTPEDFVFVPKWAAVVAVRNMLEFLPLLVIGWIAARRVARRARGDPNRDEESGL